MTEAEKHAAEAIAAIREYTAFHAATPERARAALIREGLYTEDGELAPPFRQAIPEDSRTR